MLKIPTPHTQAGAKGIKNYYVNIIYIQIFEIPTTIYTQIELKIIM